MVLSSTYAQNQTNSNQQGFPSFKNPYQNTIDSVAKANTSFWSEDVKIISKYADFVDKYLIYKANALYSKNPIIKTYLKLFPGGGKLRKDYWAIKKMGTMKKTLKY